MKLQSSALRNSLFLFALTLAFPAFRAAAQSNPDTASAQEKPSKTQQGFRPLPRNDAGLEAAQEGPEFLRRRQDWFFKPRAFPLGFIPQGARSRALQRMHQMLQNEGRLSLLAPRIGFLTPGPTTSAWQPIGPQSTSTTLFAPFTSGRVTALAVNPNNSNNVYLGGADGGLWVTTNAGTTWTPLTDFPPLAGIASIAVGALVVDPASCVSGGICSTVYVGTGEDNFGGDNIYGEGVLKCTVTAGTPPTASCTQDSTFHTPSPLDDTRGGPMIGALAFNPKTSGATAILLAGVRGRATALQSGIYCSANGGSTWAPVFGIAGIVGTDAVFASDGTAFVALGFPNGDAANNGIYKSSVAISSCTSVTDASGTSPGGTGSKWTKQTLPAGTPAAKVGRIALAILPSSTGSNATVYAAIADSTATSSNLLGVIKTTTGGTSWTQLSGAPAFCNSQCFYDLVMAVDPADTTGRTVFAGGGDAGSSNTLTRSVDGGTTWTEVSQAGSGTGLHVDTHALAFSGNGSVLYVGNDGGVWSSATNLASGTTTWTNLNAQLSITQFYPGISIHTSTPLSGLGGTQDNDLQQYQGPSLVWQAQDIGCDGGFTAIDPTIPSTIYGECEYLPNQTSFPIILVAFTGQQLFQNGFLANVGINNADRGSFIPPFVMDLKNPQTLYFGTCRVWQTKDGANTWNAISPDVTSPAHPAGCAGTGAALSTIAVAPSNSNTFYVGGDNGEIEVTSDGGMTWTSIATATLPARSITQVAVDPTTAATAYVAFSGFGSCATFCDGKGHVFKTVNGTAGASTVWVDIDGAGLPDIPVNAIVIDSDDAAHNTLYVGTDIGAFYTTTGGTTWSPLGAANSLPPAEILGLALHEPSRTLRAATHGRGVWDLNLGGQAAFGITSIAPFTANAGASSISPFTVNGNGFTASSIVNFAAGGVTTPLTTSCATATTCTTTIPSAQLLNGALAQITVTDTGKTTNAVPFTVLNPVPGITSISPTTAVAGSSGLTLIVNGSNFLAGGTLVQFNTIPLPANAVTVTNSTTLTVQVPAANLATPQTVSVDTFNPQPGGGPDTNPNPPTLTISAAPAPTITGLSPASGPVGTSVTITGTNFGPTQGTSTVTFNGTAATPTSWSATNIVAPVPTGATTGNVVVTVGGVASGGTTFTVTGGLLTTTTVTSSATSIASGGSVTLTATVATTSHGAGPTGTVQFKNGTATLSTAVTCAPTAGTSTATAFCTATLTTTLAFLAPPLAPNRVPNIRFQPVVLMAFFLLLLFLISLRRVPAPYRRGYACAGLLLLAGLVAGLVGCGGYGGGGGGGVHYDSTTAVYSGDASYAGSTSSAITITVQ